MSSAAVLIGLGVLGRRGHLGEGVQKLLGGAKKNASDLEQEIERKLNSIEDDIETKAENTASRTVEDDLSRAINDEASESARLNAVINDLFEGVPRKIEVPDPTPIIKDIEQIDISKIDGDYEQIQLPNGNKRSIGLSNNKLFYIIDENSNQEKVLHVSYRDGKIRYIDHENTIFNFNFNSGKLDNIEKVKGNLSYQYSPDGNLKGVFQKDSNNKYEFYRFENE